MSCAVYVIVGSDWLPAQVPGVCFTPPPYEASGQSSEQINQAVQGSQAISMFRLVASQQSDDLLAPTLQDKSASGANPVVDPLGQMGPDPGREADRAQRRQQGSDGSAVNAQAAVDPHAEVFAESLYPSAIQCAKCHKKIYDEWRVSSHAYAAVSPMFHRFEQTVATLTRGTSGTFCLRCHAPIATQLNHPREASIFDGPSVFREGITCVVCHRVVERYGRVNGERRVEPGSVFDPVVGLLGGHGNAEVIAKADHYKVRTDPNDKRPLQSIHRGAIQFEQLTDSSFCAGCHQVVVQPGIGLEIVYQQYRSGPACKQGVSCQDCHMGLIPGKASGYETAPAAIVNDKPVLPMKKHSNHMFHGPGYSIAHPGIFPHHEKSLRWKVEQWLDFNWREGWGTPEFEKHVAANRLPPNAFPAPWQTTDERRDARKIIDENLKLIAIKRVNSTAVLENGSRIDGPFFPNAPHSAHDLQFDFVVSNTSDGHNMPSGSLGAQPQLWLNVVLIAPDGRRLWESGHVDGNGDLADNHSLQVLDGTIPADLQLFNMQSRFLITNLKGTDREMYLPVNVDIDPLPFFRPGGVPYTVLNHAPFARMEARSIPPLDSRRASYRVPRECLVGPGRYRLSVRMRSRVEPVYFVKFVGGTPDMERALNEGIIDVHPYSTEFDVR